MPGIEQLKEHSFWKVEWSQEDQCYVESGPGLILGGCHGSDEKEVFAEQSEKISKKRSQR